MLETLPNTPLTVDQVEEIAGTDVLAAIVAAFAEGENQAPDRRQALLRQLTISLGNKVRGTERRLDQAGIEMAGLLAASIETSWKARLAPSVSMGAVSHFVKAIASWDETRGHAIAGHKDLLRISGIIGTREVAEGDLLRPEG